MRACPERLTEAAVVPWYPFVRPMIFFFFGLPMALW